MATNKLLKYPEDFSYIQKDTAEEIHIKEIQNMIDQAIASQIPVMIIQEGDTIVIKAEDRIIVSRAYYVNKQEKKIEPVMSTQTDIDKNIN